MFRYLPSPFWDERPGEGAIGLVVIHAISLPAGLFGGGWVDALFLGELLAGGDPRLAEVAGLRVSAHFLVDRQGVVTQYVPIRGRAWHAGQSRWQGREACNDHSVGIELEGDQMVPFTAIQYRRLGRLWRQLGRGIPGLGMHRVAGHQHVAPERKWDPGGRFDWEWLRREVGMVGRSEDGEWPLVWE